MTIFKGTIQRFNTGASSNFVATVNTTNGSATTIATVPIPLGSTVLIQANILGKRTGGSSGSAGDSAGYILCACYKNVAGTAAEVGESSIFSAEDQAAWTATVTANSGNALIQVTGAADNNVTWKTIVTTYQV